MVPLGSIFRWWQLVWTVLLTGHLAADVQVEAWYHLSDNAIPQDASGHQRHFRTPMKGYTQSSEDAAGGPMGPSGYMSLASLEFGRDAISGGFGIGYSAPEDNVGIEVWVKPLGDGMESPNNVDSALIFATGGLGGISLGVERVDDRMMLSGSLVKRGRVGTPVPLNAGNWTHLALVRDRGSTTFYVNGVASGDPSTATPVPAGDVHLGVSSKVTSGFKGFIDEARIFTFEPGKFRPEDLLVRNAEWFGTPGEQEEVPVSNYQIKTWQSDAGLPHNTVTSLIQTLDGYLWVGTADGLARFDGGEFKVFRSTDTPALGSGRIRSLSCGRDGVLWIITEEGSLVRHEAGKFTMLRLSSDANKPDAFTGAAEDLTGALWLSTAAREIARWDGRDYKIVARGSGPEPMELRGGADGNPVVVSSDGLKRVEGESLVSVFRNETKTTGRFLCTGANDTYWFQSNRDTIRWSADGVAKQAGWPTPDGIEIRSAREDRTGRVWLSSQGGGVFRKDVRGSLLAITTREGLGSNDVKVVFEDRVGDIWIGTDGGGLSRLTRPLVTRFDASHGLPSGRVMGLCAGDGNTLWAGIEGAGMYQFHSIAPRGVSSGKAALNFASVMTRTTGGRLYVGNSKSGLWMMQDGKFDRPKFYPAEATRVRSLFVDQDNRLWVGGRGVKRVVMYEGDKMNRLPLFPLPELVDVCALTMDREGALWIGTDGQGLLCMNQGKWQHFTKADGLRSDIIWSLRADDDGSIWVGTFGGGLSRVKEGRITTCTTREGLESDTITHIEDDSRGFFWFGSHHGIFRVPKDELRACMEGRLKRIHCVSYGLDDGLPSLECSGGFQPAGCKTSDGRLWFPTLKGVAMVNPSAIRPAPLPPSIQLDGISVDGAFHSVPSHTGESLVFSTGNHRYRFHYAGVEFAAPKALHFRTMLKGVDPTWVDAGRERVADYSQLPAGLYEFRAQACSRDGVWSDPGAIIRFEIKPLWYDRADVRIVALLVACGGVATVIWWLLRTKMRRRLAVIHQEHMIDSERQRIASNMHDDMGASLTRIALLSDLAREGAKAGGVSEEIEQIHNTANELTRTMDEIVWAVDPEHDTLDSLASYLSRVAQDLLEPVGIRCRLAIPATLPDVILSGKVRHSLYLAVKEALHNAIRHSGATEVRFALVMESAAFTIIVRDNGRGIGERQHQPDRASSGHGMKNLASRMAEIGGRCDVISEPGEGTEVSFHLAFDPKGYHRHG